MQLCFNDSPIKLRHLHDNTTSLESQQIFSAQNSIKKSIMSEEDRKKQEEREKKKAEVRARLEAASAKTKKKKGFMTPERKKRLRALLRRKAAEELKRQQEAKAAERRKVISERTGEKKNTDNLSEDELRKLCKDYHGIISKLESDKYDLEYQVRKIDYEIHELSMKVNDMRGKFIKPTLRKVPKFNVKIEKMLLNARKEVGFTVNLKAVKKDHLKQEESRQENQTAPEWSWKQKQQAGEQQAQQPATN